MNRQAITAAFCAGFIALAAPAIAAADNANLDTLQQQVERKLAIAEARGTVSRHELIALRAQLDGIAKEKAALKQPARAGTTKAPSPERLTAQLQMIDRRLTAAEHPSLASRWFRFF